MEQLFADTETAEERIEHVLDSGTPGDPVDRRLAMPKRLGLYQQIGTGSGFVECLAQ